MLVLQDAGKMELWALMLKGTIAPTDAYYNMFLYVNNYTPTAASAYLDFTQPSWFGYSMATLLRSLWNYPTIISGKASALYGSGPVTWTISSGTYTIYGYGIRSIISGNMLWAERFATPRTLIGPDSINVQPQFTFTTDPGP